MSRKISGKDRRAIIGVGGVVLAALISGIFLLLSRQPVPVPPASPAIPSVSTSPPLIGNLSSPPSGSTTPSPTPTPRGMVFDDFNNGIGGWGSKGNDVSYAQDNGNGVLRFTPPDQGSAEAYKPVGSAALSKFRGISLRINLHGATLVTPSDDANYQTASALYLNRNSKWKFVGLYDYIKNSSDGWQNVYIPLTDFTGFDKAASFSSLGFRFWLSKAGTIDVDDITFVS